MVTVKADRFFRETTISDLSHIKASLTAMNEARIGERAEAREAHARLEAIIGKHVESDETNFSAINVRQGSVEKKINIGMGVVAALQFIIMAVLTWMGAR